MKKTGSIIGGVVVLAGALMWIIREPSKDPVDSSGEYRDTADVAGAGAFAPPITDGEPSGPPGDDKAVSVEPELSEAVELLAGLDGKPHSYQDYMTAIRNLGDELSDAEVNVLLAMLKSDSSPPLARFRSVSANAVKNDVLERLIYLRQLPEGLGFQLVEMHADSKADPVWRDYCIQFMTPFYERASEELATKNTKEPQGSQSGESAQSLDALKAVREAMVSALDDRDGSYAGTALIGLEQLSRNREEFDRASILEKTVEIASDESASSESRLTALRLAAMTSLELGDQSRSTTAMTARMLAESGGTMLLRCAAVVTLGEIGQKSDHELLVSYSGSGSKELASAARIALQKMDARGL